MRIIAVAVTFFFMVFVVAQHDVARSIELIANIDKEALLLFALLVVGNLLLVCVRFHLLLRRSGVSIPFVVSARANVVGQAGGMIALQAIGQFVGRAVILKRHGVEAATIASITIYEKLASVLISFMAFIVGLYAIYGDHASILIASTGKTLPILQMMAIGGLALVISHRMGGSSVRRRFMSDLLTRRNVTSAAEVAVLTLLSQGCMIGAYVVALGALPMSPSSLGATAASAIIMFIAALPISLNGWGVREFASVYVLRDLGVPEAEALAVSIAVGLAALLALVAAVVAATFTGRTAVSSGTAADPTAGRTGSRHDGGRTLLGILAGSAGIAVFFQVHAPVQGILVNFNFADPLALLGGAYFLMQSLSSRSPVPWRVPILRQGVLLLTGVLVLAFVNGYLQFGATPWALNNRLFGWLVILGYLFTGAALAMQVGTIAARRVLQAVAAAAMVVSLYMVLVWYLRSFGLAYVQESYFPAFGHMSPNRNTVAFQLILALIATIALQTRDRRPNSSTYLSIAGGAIAVGIALTGSRAGAGAMAAVLLASIGVGLLSTRALAIQALCGAFLILPIGILVLLPPTVGGAGAGTMVVFDAVLPHGLFRPESDSERWQTLVGAFEMWAAQPILGGGLGAYIQQHALQFGTLRSSTAPHCGS